MNRRSFINTAALAWLTAPLSMALAARAAFGAHSTAQEVTADLNLTGLTEKGDRLIFQIGSL
jgi:hypothetical protein